MAAKRMVAKDSVSNLCLPIHPKHLLANVSITLALALTFSPPPVLSRDLPFAFNVHNLTRKKYKIPNPRQSARRRRRCAQHNRPAMATTTRRKDGVDHENDDYDDARDDLAGCCCCCAALTFGRPGSSASPKVAHLSSIASKTQFTSPCVCVCMRIYAHKTCVRVRIAVVSKKTRCCVCERVSVCMCSCVRVFCQACANILPTDR